MMENRPFLISLDGSSNRNTPERCPLYSRDSTQERRNVFHGYQDENLIAIKVEVKEEPEDPSVMGGEPCQEEAMPPEISTDTRETQRDIKVEEEEEEGRVKIKEEEIPPEISTDPGDTQRDVKSEEELRIIIKEEEEEEVPPEISTDTRETQRDVKAEEEEEGHVRIKEQAEDTYVVGNPCNEEEILPDISTAVKSKPKEHSRELRDKVIELHTSGRGYKTISKCLHVPVYTVRSIIKKWKVHQTTETLPRKGRPSKLSEQTRRRLVREATERPSVTLEELQKTMIESGVKVHKTTISRALNRTGLLLSKKQGFKIAVDGNG